MFRVSNAEPQRALPYGGPPGSWGISPVPQILVVNAQRVQVAGGQIVGPRGEPVLLGAPLGSLLSWAVEPA